jgi:hypothetical protein
MMDYGAPIGFRLFSMQPEKVQAFIILCGLLIFHLFVCNSNNNKAITP